MILSVKDICGVFTISPSNKEAWQKVDKAVDNALKATSERIVLDFKDVLLMEPWLNSDFRSFMAKNTADLLLYNEETAGYICTMCIAGGMGTNRVNVVKYSEEKKESKDDILIRETANDWQSIIELDPKDSSVAIVHLYRKIQAITNEKTIKFTKAAITLFNKNNPNIHKFIVQTNNVYIESFSVKAFGQMCHELKSGTPQILIKLQNDNSNIENNFRISAALGSQKEFDDPNKRIKMIEKNLKPGKVGLLMAYTKTRATDVMGRSGGGEIRSCQPAIFLGISAGSIKSEYRLKFQVFNLEHFCTNVHWALEHDGEYHKLSSQIIELSVSRCGLYSIFLGRDYHFNEPIQYHNGYDNGTMINYDLNDKGTTVKQRLTIPAFIKTVLKDHEVEADYDYLDRCIQRTHEIILRNDGQLDADN